MIEGILTDMNAIMNAFVAIELIGTLFIERE